MHQFLFQPGYWIGEGKITFSGSSEHIRFYTRWMIGDKNEGEIVCNQQVEMQGSEELITNCFILTDVKENSFQISISNELIGEVKGKGIVDQKTIAWEFRGQGAMEGFEVYEIQENGDYMLHAEYSSPDQFRTIIDGRIWLKSGE